MKPLNQSGLRYWGEILLAYSPIVILLLFLKTRSGHEWDMYCFAEWAKMHVDQGFGHMYAASTDYLPLYHYFLYFFGLMQDSPESVVSNIYKMKVITIMFEFGSALLLFDLLRRKLQDTWKAFSFSLFYLANFAVLYNSLIWGQIDGIMAFFVFAAVIAAFEKRLFPSLLMIIMALNLKFQAVIFIPLILALLIPLLLTSSRKKVWLSLGGALLVQFLILFPVILAGDLPQIWKVLNESMGYYPKISLNAYNIWVFLVNGDLYQISDEVIFMGVSYRDWGLLMFFAAGFLSLAWMIKPLIQSIFLRKNFEVSQSSVLITATLIPLLFFFLNTQMHERYSHAALIFLAAYALLYKRIWLLLIGSTAYLLNLDGAYRALKLSNYHTMIFDPRFVASLYLLLISLLFFDLLRMMFRPAKDLTGDHKALKT
jgi:Gpi18-like mannosyltransferase